MRSARPCLCSMNSAPVRPKDTPAAPAFQAKTKTLRLGLYVLLKNVPFLKPIRPPHPSPVGAHYPPSASNIINAQIIEHNPAKWPPDFNFVFSSLKAVLQRKLH